MRTAFDPEGDIRGVDLLACLVTLWREGASGSLQFSRSGATAGFEIAAGEIIGSSASDARFETAAILARAGKLDTRTLERLAAPEGADRALLALQAGVLTRREWRWGEKIRAVEILSDLLTWLEGEYWFFRATEAEGEKAEPRLPIPRLVLELFLRSRDRSLVLKYLGGADVPLARAANFDAEFATFGLTADAESVVRLIDGTATAEEIASEAPAEAFAVEKLLAALVTLGLVHPEFAPGGATPEPGDTAHAGPAPPAPEEVLDEEVEIRGEWEAGTSREEEGSGLEEPALPGNQQPAEGLSLEGYGEDLPREQREEGPQELGERFGEEVMPEQEPMTDAALAGGRALESDLESAALGQPAAPAAVGSLAGPGAGGEIGFDRPLGASTGDGLPGRPARRSGPLLLWTLAVLAVAVAATLWMRSRGAAPSTQLGAPQPPTPTEVPVAVAAPLSQTIAAPTEATPGPAPAAAPTQRPTRARPPVRPTASRSTPVPVQAPPPSGGEASRQHWLDRADRDAKRLAGDRKTRYAVQLELVCEMPSLTEAFLHDRPAGNMWVLATPFEGRTCFRVLWGRYPTIEAARRGLAGAPRFFSTPKNHPAVTGVR